MGTLPAGFVPKWAAMLWHLDAINWWAVAVAALALAIIVWWPRINACIRGPFVALIATTLLVRLLHVPVETIATRFGAIDAGLPVPVIPHVTLDRVAVLARPALAIALLAAIESLLSAVGADGMIGGRHRSNMGLVAQGVANIASPIFRGMPATRAIARTATNVKNGGRPPVAGLTPAPAPLLITLFFRPPAGPVPADVEVYEISGPFFFGAAETFRSLVADITRKPKVLILRMRHVPAIDSTGLHALRDLVRRGTSEGTLVLLSDVHAQPVVALERSGFLYEIGEEDILRNIDGAPNRARVHPGLPLEARPAFATPTARRERPPPRVSNGCCAQ